jgi:group I intron endonuclease
MMTIYEIVNLKTNKKYIGSAVNFDRRKKVHLYELKKNIHHSKLLQNSWNKYTPKDFIFNIIEEVFDRTILLEREQHWLDYYQTYNKNFGYNMSNKSTQPMSLSIPVY